MCIGSTHVREYCTHSCMYVQFCVIPGTHECSYRGPEISKKNSSLFKFKSFWDVQRKLPVHATGTYAHTVHKSSRSRHINVYECIFNLFVMYLLFIFYMYECIFLYNLLYV